MPEGSGNSLGPPTATPLFNGGQLNVPGMHPFFQMGAQPFLNALNNRTGSSPSQFLPGASFHDQSVGNRFATDRIAAMQAAGQLDRDFLTQFFLGLSHLADDPGPGQRRPTNTERERAARQAAELLAYITTHIADLDPELIDQIGGSRGLAANLASGVTSGMRFQRNGNTANAGAFSSALHRALYPSDGTQRDLHGLGANKAGQLFDELSRRGLLHLSGTSETDVTQTANAIQQWSGVAAACRDLLASNGRPNASMSEIFNTVDTLTQGGTAGASPDQLQMQIRRAHELARDTPGGLSRYLAMLQHGGAAAAGLGLGRSIAGHTAAASTAFGGAFGRVAGRQGSGGLSQEDAALLDQQLRTSAAASPMANSLGAIMAMQSAGVLRPGSEGANIAGAIEGRNMEALRSLVGQSQSQIMRRLRDSGLQPGTIAQFFRDTATNQQWIAAKSIQDIVRQMQGVGELARLMDRGLSSGMGSALRNSGLDNASMRQVRRAAASAARQALMTMDGDMLSSMDQRVIEERRRRVAAAMSAAIGPEMHSRIGDATLQEMAQGAISGLSASIPRSRSLSRFRNLAGLVSMNRADVFSAGNQAVHRADQGAAAASRTDSLGQAPPGARVMDAVAGAGRNTRITDLLRAAVGSISNAEIMAALGGPQPNSPTDNLASGAGIAGRAVDDFLPGQGLSSDQRRNIGSAMGGLGSIARSIDSFLPGQGIFSTGRASSPPDFNVSQVSGLQARDREVRRQEGIHHAAAGEHAIGPPNYVYRAGPDGRQYAIGGHVLMDMSPVRDDPVATIRKMAQIRHAATAPGFGLSADDMSVASRAGQIGQQAAMALGTPASTWSTPDVTAAMPQPSSMGAMAGSTTEQAPRQSGPMRITGTLTIRADGTADIEAFPNNLGSPASMAAF